MVSSKCLHRLPQACGLAITVLAACALFAALAIISLVPDLSISKVTFLDNDRSWDSALPVALPTGHSKQRFSLEIKKPAYLPAIIRLDVDGCLKNLAVDHIPYSVGEICGKQEHHYLLLPAYLNSHDYQIEGTIENKDNSGGFDLLGHHDIIQSHLDYLWWITLGGALVGVGLLFRPSSSFGRGVRYGLFIILVTEAILRLYLAIPLIRELLLGSGPTSSELRWLDQHANDRRLMDPIDVHDEALGWRLKPRLRDYPVVGTSVASSNSLGVRGVKEFTPLVPIGKRRAFLLGDSFAFGFGSNDDETIGTYTSELAPMWEIVNIGNHGYGHDQAVMSFERFSEVYASNVAVLAFVAWDIERNITTFSYFAKPMIKRSKTWEIDGLPVPTAAQVQERAAWRPAFLTTVLLLKESLYDSLAAEYDNLEVTREIIRHFVAISREKKITPAIIFLTDSEAVLTHKTTEQESSMGAWILSVCSEEGIECSSNEALFAASDIKGLFLEDGHYTNIGNKLTAEALAKLLSRLEQ